MTNENSALAIVHRANDYMITTLRKAMQNGPQRPVPPFLTLPTELHLIIFALAAGLYISVNGTIVSLLGLNYEAALKSLSCVCRRFRQV
ncbi:hypothetical protein BT69DRAFT_1279442, partial [Atractiella rhizophila]